MVAKRKAHPPLEKEEAVDVPLDGNDTSFFASQDESVVHEAKSNTKNITTADVDVVRISSDNNEQDNDFFLPWEDTSSRCSELSGCSSSSQSSAYYSSGDEVEDMTAHAVIFYETKGENVRGRIGNSAVEETDGRIVVGHPVPTTQQQHIKSTDDDYSNSSSSSSSNCSNQYDVMVAKRKAHPPLEKEEAVDVPLDGNDTSFFASQDESVVHEAKSNTKNITTADVDVVRISSDNNEQDNDFFLPWEDTSSRCSELSGCSSSSQSSAYYSSGDEVEDMTAHAVIFYETKGENVRGRIGNSAVEETDGRIVVGHPVPTTQQHANNVAEAPKPSSHGGEQKSDPAVAEAATIANTASLARPSNNWLCDESAVGFDPAPPMFVTMSSVIAENARGLEVTLSTWEEVKDPTTIEQSPALPMPINDDFTNMADFGDFLSHCQSLLDDRYPNNSSPQLEAA